MDLSTSSADPRLWSQADDPANGFSGKSQIVQSGVAVPSKLAFGETVAELGLDYHDAHLLRLCRVRKADLEVDPVLLGMGLRVSQDIVIWKVRNPQGFEERADASGTQPGLTAVEERFQTFRGSRFGQSDSPVGREGVEGMIRTEGAEHGLQNPLVQIHGTRPGEGRRKAKRGQDS